MSDELALQIAKLKHGDHVCPLYETMAEQFAVAVPFVRDGLTRGDRCVYCADERTPEQVEAALEQGGVDVAREKARDALRIITSDNVYLRSGQFDPDVMMDLIRRGEKDALADGFGGWRLAGEMTWALRPDTSVENLTRFEALLENNLVGSHGVVLCQYDYKRYSSAIIYEVLRTHPVVILGEQVCPNPYYEPAELVLHPASRVNDELKTRRVAWWISRLKQARVVEQDRDRARAELARHAVQLQGLAKAALKIHSGRSPGEVIRTATDAAREIIGGHLAGGHVVLDGATAQAFVVTDKYIDWRNFEVQPDSAGLAAQVRESNRPLRLTQAELEVQGSKLAFGNDPALHPPLRGFLAAPLVASKGRNMGMIALTDKCDGEFTADDEAILIQLAQLASIASENAWLYERIRTGHDRLHRLSRQFLDLQETERQHLARELHDEVGQLLTGLRLLLNPNGNGDMRPRLDQARGIVSDLLERIRGLSFDLRPAALDQLGLIAALMALFERFTGRTKVAVHFKHQGMPSTLPSAVEVAAYRVVQEALTNVARHAKVTEACVEIWATPESLALRIEDCGGGFDVEAVLAKPTIGLAGMRERVQLLGGQLTIESRRGQGTQISVEIPVADTVKI